MILKSGPMEIREPTMREFSLNSSIFTNSSLTLNVLLNDYECHDEYVDMMFKEVQLAKLKCSIFMDKDEGSSPLEKIARIDRKSTRLNSSHRSLSRMPSSA